jgi:hypothetical protein
VKNKSTWAKVIACFVAAYCSGLGGLAALECQQGKLVILSLMIAPTFFLVAALTLWTRARKWSELG